MVDWIVIIIAGALIGWIASMIMKTDAQMGAMANILVGIVGSVIGRWLFASLLGSNTDSAGAFSFAGLLYGIVGAVILLAILKFFNVFGQHNQLH